MAVLHYVERRLPPWLAATSAAPLVDTTHQLVVVGARQGVAAVYASDTAARDGLAASWDPGAVPTVVRTSPLSTAALTEAFIDGPARSVWLAGIHRSTPHKADAKALVGPDLRRALDPLGDQTYALQAARSTLPAVNGGEAMLVGVTPRASSVWCAPVRDFDTFCSRMATVLDAAARTSRPGAGAGTPGRRPFPALAHPASAGTVRDAIDVHVMAPALFADPDTLRPGELAEAERWAYTANYVVGARNGANFDLVVRAGNARARLRFTARTGLGNRVTYDVAAAHAANAGDSFVREALTACRRRAWLRVRYASGHVVSDGELYEQQLLDIPFTGWAFAPFPSAGHTSREKPLDATGSFNPALIGTQQSLFCWVHQHWAAFATQLPGASAVPPGATWLVCDDGSMEVGDFIEVQELSAGKALVTLLHLKACSRTSPQRRIATTDYEVVVAQALKNLRGLDRSTLGQRLQAGAGKAIARAVWRDGQPATRAGCVQFLNGCTAIELRVVVVQPSLTAAEHARLRNATTVAPTHLVQRQQLDTLLLAAEANCRALGATFCVVGHDV